MSKSKTPSALAKNTKERVISDKKLRKHVSKSSAHLSKAAKKVASSDNKRKAASSRSVKKNLKASVSEANKALVRYQNPPQTKKRWAVLGVVAALFVVAGLISSKAKNSSPS